MLPIDNRCSYRFFFLRNEDQITTARGIMDADKLQLACGQKCTPLLQRFKLVLLPCFEGDSGLDTQQPYSFTDTE
jgi:hypothetical protein